jgi:hypothetical protein
VSSGGDIQCNGSFSIDVWKLNYQVMFTGIKTPEDCSIYRGVFLLYKILPKKYLSLRGDVPHTIINLYHRGRNMESALSYTSPMKFV